MAEIRREVETFLPTEHGDYTVYLYLDSGGKEHLALVKGTLSPDTVLCRVHSECLTGEVFGSLKCDCKEQLEIAFQKIDNEGAGVILYLRQEGRGIGLRDKLKAYKLQLEGQDTVDANLALGHEPDERDYEIAKDILRDLGVRSVKLMTNNPDKVKQLEQYGIKVNERIAIIPTKISEYNRDYIKTKLKRMHHFLGSIK